MTTQILTNIAKLVVPGWRCFGAYLEADLTPYTKRGVSNYSSAIKAIVKEILQNRNQPNQHVVDRFISANINCNPWDLDSLQCIERFVEEKFKVIDALSDEPDVFSVVNDPIGKSTENSRYVIIVNSNQTVNDLRARVIQEIFYIVLHRQWPNSQRGDEKRAGAQSLGMATAYYCITGSPIVCFLMALSAECTTRILDLGVRQESKQLTDMYEEKRRWTGFAI